jgi:hypothetical protein
MLAAICAPPTPSQTPVVIDLASANLRFKRDRIANLCRLINLSPYLYPLLKLIGYRDFPEFTVIERYDLSYHISKIKDQLILLIWLKAQLRKLRAIKENKFIFSLKIEDR